MDTEQIRKRLDVAGEQENQQAKIDGKSAGEIWAARWANPSELRWLADFDPEEIEEGLWSYLYKRLTTLSEQHDMGSFDVNFPDDDELQAEFAHGFIAGALQVSVEAGVVNSTEPDWKRVGKPSADLLRDISQKYPNESDAEKYRLAQAQMLIDEYEPTNRNGGAS